MNYCIYRSKTGQITRTVSDMLDSLGLQLRDGDAACPVPPGSGPISWVTHEVVDGEIVAKAAPEAPPFHGAQWDPDEGWVDRRSLEEVRVATWKAFKASAQTPPLEFEGHVFQADEGSRQALNDYAVAALLDPGFTVVFTTATNTEVALDAESLKRLQLAMALHVRGHHAARQAARAHITSAASALEVTQLVRA